MKESTSVALAKTTDRYLFVLTITRSAGAIVEIHESEVLDLHFKDIDEPLRLVPISRFQGVNIANTRSITAYYHLPEEALNTLAQHPIDHLRVHFQFKGILKVADNPTDDIGLYYKSDVKKEDKQQDLIRLVQCIMDAG